MARLNVEEHAWPRVGKLATIMGCSDREALGTVAMLWRDSQDVLSLEGTREDIIDWCHLYGMPDELVDKWLFGLERARFITKADGGKFHIHGNETQINNIVERTSSSAKGGEATKAKWAAIKAKRRAEEGRSRAGRPADTTPGPGLDRAQFNADQGITTQSKAEEPPAPPPPADGGLGMGPVPELADIPATEYLRDENITHFTQYIWLKAHGLGTVRRELPLALAKYLTDEKRRAKRNFSGYFSNWLEKAARNAQAPPHTAADPPGRRGSLAEPEQCELYTMLEDPDTQERTPVCKRTHEPGEMCTVTKKKVEASFKPKLVPGISGRDRAAGEREESA